MKTNYLKLILISFVLFMLSIACGDLPLVQPEEESATTTPSLTATEIILPNVTVENTIQVTPTSEVIKVSPTSTSSPTPTKMPSPTPLPSPTIVTLSPLDENLQTIIFTTNSEQGPNIWRVQVDEQGKKATPVELVERVDLPTYIPIRIYGLYPSPDGQQVAVDWAWGTATHVHILDVGNGQLTPLFGETDIDQRVTFLDWTPDGQNVLVMGGTANPDLGNSAWLVNINTHKFDDIDIRQEDEIPHIYGASFSPHGKMIVYTHFHVNGEIWRLNLENSEQLLLHKAEAAIINVSWSSDGNYIAFTQLHKDEKFPQDKFITGELYVMKADGNEKQMISSIMVDYKNHRFRPVWSPDSQQLVFVKSESLEPEQKLEQFISNIYMIEVKSNQVKQLTSYQNAKIINPVWKISGSQIAFLISEGGSDTPFYLNKMSINEQEISSLDIDLVIISDTLVTYPNYFDTQSHIVWLP